MRRMVTVGANGVQTMPTRNPMQLGVIGLGRMGANIARRLMRDGHTCVVYDVNPGAVAALEQDGSTVVVRASMTAADRGGCPRPGAEQRPLLRLRLTRSRRLRGQGAVGHAQGLRWPRREEHLTSAAT